MGEHWIAIFCDRFLGKLWKCQSTSNQPNTYIILLVTRKIALQFLLLSGIVLHCLALLNFVKIMKVGQHLKSQSKSGWEGSSSEIWLICEVGVRNIFYSVSLTKREESTLPSLHLICKNFGFFFLSWNVKMTKKFGVKICQSEKQKFGVNQYMRACGQADLVKNFFTPSHLNFIRSFLLLCTSMRDFWSAQHLVFRVTRRSRVDVR